MPVSHVTLFFVQGRQQWAEQLWRVDGTFAGAMTAALALAHARWPILGADVSLTRVRVSQLGAPRISASRHVLGTPAAVPAVPADQAALITLLGSGDRSPARTFWLHGLPQGAWQQQGGIFSLSRQWAGPIAAWLNLLTLGGWRIQSTAALSRPAEVTALAPVANPPTPPLPLVGAQWTLLGVAKFLLAAYLAPEPAPPPDLTDVSAEYLLALLRAKWSSGPSAEAGVNGEWPIVGQLAGIVGFVGDLFAPGSWLGSGTVQFRKRSYVPIGGWTFLRPGVHQVGPARRSNQPGAPSADPLRGLPEFVTVPAPPPVPTPAEAAPQIAPYASPPGTVPVPPALIQPPPPPPPGPGPFVPESQPPRAVTITTLQDVGIWMRQFPGYYGFPDSYNPIGIAEVTNLVDTWSIWLYGQKPEITTSPGVLTSVATGVGLLTDYLAAAKAALLATVPAGASILVFGYSLGGMVAEQLWALRDLPYTFLDIVTLASPVTCVSYFSMPIVRFAAFDDLVPIMTPVSFLATVTATGGLLYNLVPVPPPNNTFPRNHTEFCTSASLGGYNAWGQPLGGVGPPLELAPMQMFPLGP